MEGKTVVDQQKECKIYAETETKAKSVGIQNDIGSSQEEHTKILQMRDLLEKHDPTSKVSPFLFIYFFLSKEIKIITKYVLVSKCYMIKRRPVEKLFTF